MPVPIAASVALPRTCSTMRPPGSVRPVCADMQPPSPARTRVTVSVAGEAAGKGVRFAGRCWTTARRRGRRRQPVTCVPRRSLAGTRSGLRPPSQRDAPTLAPHDARPPGRVDDYRIGGLGARRPHPRPRSGYRSTPRGESTPHPQGARDRCLSWTMSSRWASGSFRGLPGGLDPHRRRREGS